MVEFSANAAQRISRAVRWVEQQSPGITPNKRGANRSGDLGRWAVITAIHETIPWAYYFSALAPQTDVTINVDDSWGWGVARDVWGSEWVLLGEPVWVEPSKVADYWVFQYCPPMRTGKADGVISKRSSTTPGSGQVEIEYRDLTDGTLIADETITVYSNWNTEAGESAKKTPCQIIFSQGVWWLSAMDCAADGSS